MEPNNEDLRLAELFRKHREFDQDRERFDYRGMEPEELHDRASEYLEEEIDELCEAIEEAAEGGYTLEDDREIGYEAVDVVMGVRAVTDALDKSLAGYFEDKLRINHARFPADDHEQMTLDDYVEDGEQ